MGDKPKLLDLSRKPDEGVSDHMLECASSLRRYAADIEKGKTAAIAVVSVDYNTDGHLGQPKVCRTFGSQEHGYVLGGAVNMLALEINTNLVEQLHESV